MATLHSTILIGFGRYGLSLLQRFLVNAASRGDLQWEAVEGHPAGRRPRRLALLYVPAADEPGIKVTESLTTGQTLEMMQDLFEQIQSVAGKPADMTAAISDAGWRLLGGRP